MATPNIPKLIRDYFLTIVNAGTDVFAETLYPSASGYSPEDNLALCFRVQSAALMDDSNFINDVVIELRIYGSSELELQTEVMALRDGMAAPNYPIRFARVLTGPFTAEDARTEWLYTRINYHLHVVGG